MDALYYMTAAGPTVARVPDTDAGGDGLEMVVLATRGAEPAGAPGSAWCRWARAQAVDAVVASAHAARAAGIAPAAAHATLDPLTKLLSRLLD